jgi:DNA-binding MarR family transcriptional regulator
MNHSTEGKLLTDIILEIFKLNGFLILEGDQITKELGLSSARWKVLGALSGSKNPITVPDIARMMGLTRQAVQRLVNEMIKDGLLYFQANPSHKRAKLLALTEKGKDFFERLEQKQIPWVNSIADGFEAKDLQIVYSVLQKVTGALET